MDARKMSRVEKYLEQINCVKKHCISFGLDYEGLKMEIAF